MRTLLQYLLMPFRLIAAIAIAGFIAVWALILYVRDALVSTGIGKLEKQTAHNHPRRYDAVEDLKRSSDPQATELLLKLLHDPDPALANKAAEALGHRKDPAVTPGLVEALKASDGDLRCRAARALGDSGDHRVRHSAAMALRGMNSMTPADRDRLASRDRS